MGDKNNKIYILLTVFNMTSYNLVLEFIVIVWISFVVLVSIVTTLPSYKHTYIYQMEKCHLSAIATEIIYMSTESGFLPSV